MFVMCRLVLPLLGIALVIALALWAVAGPDPSASAAAGPAPDRPVAVSLVQLIANPDAFDGKLVRVTGFVRVEHEGTAIYLHREDWEHMLTKNGLWLAANDSAPEGSREAGVNNRYALIEGRFNAKKKGHRGLWSGSIEGISRMEAWDVGKRQK
jgi:hypothetical protein